MFGGIRNLKIILLIVAQMQWKFKTTSTCKSNMYKFKARAQVCTI